MTAPIAVFQMDPLESINPAGDSTLLLGLEAQRRGYRPFCYTPDRLRYENGSVKAFGHYVQFIDGDPCFKREEAELLNLHKAALVLMRQDPPFDMAYIATTHILETIQDETPVFNRPESVRDNPEKWCVNAFPEFLPPTLISADLHGILDFYTRHRDVVIKPLYGFGGHSVFHLREGDHNALPLLENLQAQHKEPLVVQAFLPDVSGGDIRVIFAGGKVIGQFARQPAETEIRANMRVGGTPVAIDLTPRQQEICDAIGPMLKANGLMLAGIDLIGDYLIEINLTSPTGLRALNDLYNMQSESLVWDAFDL